MSERYIIDAYAWVEYLIGSDSGKKVKAELENDKSEIFTCTVTIAEVVSKTAREGRNVETAFEVLTSNSRIVDADQWLSRDAGQLHAQTNRKVKDFSLAHAYVLASARKLNARILTGDPHFRELREATVI